jgi:hypothetical protein
MSITRRKFLRAGTLVALSAAVPLKGALLVSGQTRKGSKGLPGAGLTSQSPSDLLGSYSKSAFSSYLNSIFRLHTGYSSVDVTLVQVDDTEPQAKGTSAGGECFSLVFVGGSVALSQGTYQVEHPALGSFQLFLVPGGADRYGAQSYVAIINRLPYTWTLIDVPETKKAKTNSPTTTLQGTKPAETTAPPKTVEPIEPIAPRKMRVNKRRVAEEDFQDWLDQ